MIFILIILFMFFLITITIVFFKSIFIKGETFNIRDTKIGKSRKLNEYLSKLDDNLKYMEDIPYEWIYLKSNDGLTLAGKLYKNDNSYKMVILFHGYRSIAENDFSVYFKWYYDNGYNVLLINQRAHGRSEGKYITFGALEQYDCIKWCEYVSTKFDYIKQIVLGGMSMGSTTILLASGHKLPSIVKGIVADCGFTSPKDIIEKVASMKYGIDINVLLPIINILCIINAKFNIYKNKVKEALKNNELPVLFIHGLSDDFVPSWMSKQNYENCHSRKELVLVDCVHHGLSCMHDEEKVRISLENFLKSLA